MLVIRISRMWIKTVTVRKLGYLGLSFLNLCVIMSLSIVKPMLATCSSFFWDILSEKVDRRTVHVTTQA
ncbi:hypothetical protein HanRHA438_Chr08g0368621 [Helianthus annuus]|nr:hypothetical protein HanRHA438_Chr08g0368621 [Helianthus annuus]